MVKPELGFEAVFLKVTLNLYFISLSITLKILNYNKLNVGNKYFASVYKGRRGIFLKGWSEYIFSGGCIYAKTLRVRGSQTLKELGEHCFRQMGKYKKESQVWIELDTLDGKEKKERKLVCCREGKIILLLLF